MRKIILLIFCIFTSCSIFSANASQYSDIYRSFKNHSAEVLNRLGEKYYQSGSLDSALVCFSIVSGGYIPVANNTGADIYAHAFNRCGVIYMRYNSYTKALNMFLKSLDICGNSLYSAKIYNNISNLYCMFRDYKMANNYCEKAYSLAINHKDKELTEVILNNLIGINYYLQDYQKVKKYITAFKDQNPENAVLYQYYHSRNNGVLNFMQKKYSSALSDFKVSLFYADSCTSPARFKYVSLSHISKCFSFMHRADSALYYMKKGEKVLHADNYTELMAECYSDIASVYSSMGDEKLSLYYKKLYLGIADSIFNVQEFGRIKDMQFIHEMENIEKQVSQLTDERIIKDNQIKSQRQTLHIFIGAMIVILALLAIMYMQLKRLRESNRELFNRNIEIMESDEERKKQRRELLNPVITDNSDESLLADKVEIETDSENTEVKSKYQGSLITSEEKKRIRDAILNVMDNTLDYCSSSFTLEKLAALVNSKSKYVSQVINESFNKNFNLFVNEYRIKEVQRRLMDTDNYGKYTIVFIATSVGFKSDANFNLVFKKMTGMTPTAYRNMVNKCCRSN